MDDAPERVAPERVAPERVAPERVAPERVAPDTVVGIGASAKTRKGVRRRAAILDAAAELFRERGFRATSLDEIGAAAGISGPAIYRYFKSKDELLSVLVEEAAITWRATVDEVLNTDAPPLVTLERLIDAAVALELKNGSLRVVWRQEYHHLDHDARRRVARIDRVTMAEWVHLLCEVRPALTDEDARVAVLMLDGFLRSVSRLNTSLDRERLARVMKDMALGALLALGDQRPAAVLLA